VHSLGEPVIEKSLDGIIRSWNTGAEKLYGYTAAEAIGQSISLLVPPDRQEELATIMGLLGRGEEIEHLETVRRHKDGRELVVSLTVTPLRKPSGEIVGAAAVAYDITERVRREACQRFLAEAGRALASSLDQAEIVAEVVRLAVPRFADWCTLELFGRDGDPAQVAVAHVDEGKEPLLRRLQQRPPLGIDARAGEQSTGGTLTAEIDEALLDRTARNARERSLLRRLTPRSAFVAPVVARGEVLGAMIVARSAGRDRFDALDAATLEDFAHRAGLAIENATLHSSSREARSAAEQAVRRTRRLQWATAALSEAATPIEVCEVLVGQGAAAVGADAGFVRLLSEEGGRLELAASVGFGDTFVGTHASLPIDSGFPGAEAARDGKARWYESSAAIAADNPEFAAVAALHGALAVIPLRSASGLLGVIALSFSDERRFTHEERELLVTLTALCAQALERAQLYKAEQDARELVEKAAERTSRLQSITAGLSSATTPGEVAAVIIEQALVALGAAAGIVALVADGGRMLKTLRAVDTGGNPIAVWSSFPADLRLPLTDAVRAGTPIVVETLAERYRRYPEIANVSRFSANGAIVALPLRVEGRTLGGLGLSFAEARGFDEEEVRYLETVSEQCAQALERARLYEDELESRRIAEEAREQYRLLLGALDVERRSLGQLIERLHEGVVAVRPDGTIAFSNARARAFVAGISEEAPLPEEWLGFPLREFALALFDTDARKETRAGDTASGHLYSLTGLPASDSETAIVVINDLSERERREQAAREFVANAAHELRTPVAGIAVAVDALQAGAKEEPARRDEFLGHIERESARLARLARSLLVLARTQAGGRDARDYVCVRCSPRSSRGSDTRTASRSCSRARRS
jgi:PAS domain S-box-containing protein